MSCLKFQSTHPERGGTVAAALEDSEGGISIHPPRAGWDSVPNDDVLFGIHISIHPPRVGWDTPPSRSQCSVHPQISIHPPRAGWDTAALFIRRQKLLFQSTHPERGGTQRNCDSRLPMIFQSTHPERGGTLPHTALVVHIFTISIHPPRAGWDVFRVWPLPIRCLFQSTHPERGGTRNG